MSLWSLGGTACCFLVYFYFPNNLKPSICLLLNSELILVFSFNGNSHLNLFLWGRNNFFSPQCTSLHSSSLICFSYSPTCHRNPQLSDIKLCNLWSFLFLHHLLSAPSGSLECTEQGRTIYISRTNLATALKGQFTFFINKWSKDRKRRVGSSLI